MTGYRHLDLDERRKLRNLIALGKSVAQAAVELGRHASTLYLELKRKPRGLKISPESTIAARLPEIAARTSYSHWEGDLVVFRLAFGKAI